MLARPSDQALQILERYKTRLDSVSTSLSALEVEDLVTVRDVATALQRAEMVRRIAEEIEGYVVELGSDELFGLIQRMAPLTDGLGLEKVLVRANFVDEETGEVRDRIMHISNPAGRGLTLRFDEPSDRPIRPLFPKHFRREMQVIATVMSFDKDNESDWLSVCGASAAMHISNAPFQGPVAGVRVCEVDGELVLNPKFDDVARATISLVFAGTAEAITMIEGGCLEAQEDRVPGGAACADQVGRDDGLAMARRKRVAGAQQQRQQQREQHRRQSQLL